MMYSHVIDRCNIKKGHMTTQHFLSCCAGDLKPSLPKELFEGDKGGEELVT